MLSSKIHNYKSFKVFIKSMKSPKVYMFDKRDRSKFEKFDLDFI